MGSFETSEIMTNLKPNGRLERRENASKSGPRMTPITFCRHCGEAIPANALSCFRCHARQPAADKPLQVVFCERCGEDFPARAMACYHCGHINPRHPYLKGHLAG